MAKVLRLRGGGDHNVARERPEGCPYKSINVRRGNAMRFLVLDHIKEKPVRTKKALLYILSKDKRRAMENIAAQALFEKVDAYPPEERFYPLHVKPVDDLYYIPEKKVDQMVYVVNKLKKLSIESIVSDVTWETSTDDDGGDEDYIVDLKTDKLQDNAERCDKTLEEIEKYYFEADDGGKFSPRDPASPVSSGPPFRSIYESQTDTEHAAFHQEFELPPALRRTKSIPLTQNERKIVKMDIRNRKNLFTLKGNLSSSEEDLKRKSRDQIDRNVLWRQYAQSHLKNKYVIELPSQIQLNSGDEDPDKPQGNIKRRRKQKFKKKWKEEVSSSDEEYDERVKCADAPRKKVHFKRSRFTESVGKVPSKLDHIIGDSQLTNNPSDDPPVEKFSNRGKKLSSLTKVLTTIMKAQEPTTKSYTFKDRIKQFFTPIKMVQKVLKFHSNVIVAKDHQNSTEVC